MAHGFPRSRAALIGRPIRVLWRISLDTALWPAVVSPDLVEEAAIVVPLFAAALFLSAVLLFLVQSMVGRMILPAVWKTWMMFFQGVLLAGHAYSHASVAVLAKKKWRPLAPDPKSSVWSDQYCNVLSVLRWR